MSARRNAVITLATVGALAVLGAGLWFYGGTELTEFDEQKWRPDVDAFEAMAPEYIHAFCADAKVVAKSRIPRKAGTAQNAGGFINPRLAWGTPDAGVFGPSMPVGPDDAAVSRLAPMQDWVDQLTPADCVGVDTAWLHQLGPFDHWSLLAPGSPNADAPQTRAWLASSVGLPRNDRLFAAAKLHLNCAMLDGGFVDAARDVEQLARLAYSTESTIPAYSAAGLMRLQAQAIAAARERGIDAGDLQPVSDDEVAAYRRMVRGIVGLTSAAVDDGAFDSMLDCARAAGFECIALTEGAVYWSSVRQGALPWAGRARLRAALVERGLPRCRLDFAKFLHGRPLLDASEVRQKDQKIGTILQRSLQWDALTTTWPLDAGTPDAGR